MAVDPSEFAGCDVLDNHRMSENDFVKRLLPHLVPSEDGSRKAVDIYIAATGNPYRMIDVTAPNGEVLYTVPPLLSQTPMSIQSSHDPETDVGEITAQFQAELTSNHPGLVIDKFTSRVMAIHRVPVEDIQTIYSFMWARIYQRYDIPLERLFGDKADEMMRLLNNKPSTEERQNKAPVYDFDEDDFDPM
jgi:hypothetical protein